MTPRYSELVRSEMEHDLGRHDKVSPSQRLIGHHVSIPEFGAVITLRFLTWVVVGDQSVVGKACNSLKKRASFKTVPKMKNDQARTPNNWAGELQTAVEQLHANYGTRM